MPLAEADRQKLDGIVGQMESNGESPEAIHSLIDDFRSKYEAPTLPAPEGPLMSAFRSFASGVLPAAGTAGGAIAAGAVATPETVGAGTVPAAIAGGTAGGWVGKRLQHWIMGDKWFRENELQMMANAAENPVSAGAGEIIPTLASMAGGSGLTRTIGQKAVQEAERIAGEQLAPAAAKAIAAGAEKEAAETMAVRMGESALAGARLGGSHTAQAMEGGEDVGFGDFADNMAKSALQFGPLGVLPHAETLAKALGYAVPQAAITTLSGAIYDTIVHGKKFDPEEITKHTGADIIPFALFNAVSHGLNHAEMKMNKGATLDKTPVESDEDVLRGTSGMITEPPEEVAPEIAQIGQALAAARHDQKAELQTDAAEHAERADAPATAHVASQLAVDNRIAAVDEILNPEPTKTDEDSKQPTTDVLPPAPEGTGESGTTSGATVEGSAGEEVTQTRPEEVAPETQAVVEQSRDGELGKPRGTRGVPVVMGQPGGRITSEKKGQQYQDEGGWKLHLAVKPENYKAVDEWLANNHEGGYKLLSGGDAGESDFTVYVGSRDAAEDLAKKIHGDIGDLVETREAGTDRHFNEKVTGRFDVQRRKTGYEYYGAEGIPFDEVAASDTAFSKNRESWRGKARPHLDRIHKELTDKYGDFYKGTKTHEETTKTENERSGEQQPTDEESGKPEGDGGGDKDGEPASGDSAPEPVKPEAAPVPKDLPKLSNAARRVMNQARKKGTTKDTGWLKKADIKALKAHGMHFQRENGKLVAVYTSELRQRDFERAQNQPRVARRSPEESQVFQNGHVVNTILGSIGKLMSKSNAQKDPEFWSKNKSLWDDAPRLSHPTHNIIYGRNGGLHPDEVATALHEHGIGDGSVEEMWKIIDAESKGAVKGAEGNRQTRRELERQEKEQKKLDQAAKKQEKDFDHETAKTRGHEAIDVWDLNEGDTVWVDGEPLKVESIGRDMDITLEDGARFGRQILESGEKIFVEKVDKAPQAETPDEPWHHSDYNPATGRIETPDSLEAERKEKVARLKQLRDEVMPLANKGDLTAGEAAQYKKLMLEIEGIRFDIKKPLEESKIPSEEERKSSLPASTVKIASDELAANRNIYDAVTEAAIGVHYDADTPIDDIVNGKSETVTPDELYNAFEGTRDALREQFGETVPLFRSEGQQKEKSTQNWSTTRAGAEQYGGKITEKNVPVEDVWAVNVGLKGKYEEVIVGKRPESAREEPEHEQQEPLSAKEIEDEAVQKTTPESQLEPARELIPEEEMPFNLFSETEAEKAAREKKEAAEVEQRQKTEEQRQREEAEAQQGRLFETAPESIKPFSSLKPVGPVIKGATVDSGHADVAIDRLPPEVRKLVNEARERGDLIITDRANLEKDVPGLTPEELAFVQGNDAEGFFHNGRMVVVTDNVAVTKADGSGIRAVARVINHELFHDIARAVIKGNKEFSERWEDIVARIPHDDLDRLAKTYDYLSDWRQNNDSRNKLVEEWAAEKWQQYQSGRMDAAERTTFEKFLDLLKSVWRHAMSGFKKNSPTDEDLHAFFNSVASERGKDKAEGEGVRLSKKEKEKERDDEYTKLLNGDKGDDPYPVKGTPEEKWEWGQRNHQTETKLQSIIDKAMMQRAGMRLQQTRFGFNLMLGKERIEGGFTGEQDAINFAMRKMGDPPAVEIDASGRIIPPSERVADVQKRTADDIRNNIRLSLPNKPETHEEEADMVRRGELTPAANDLINIRRKQLGMDELVAPETQERQEIVDRAMRRWEMNPDYPKSVVDRLEKSGEAPTQEDVVAIAVRARELENQRDRLTDTLNDPKATEGEKIDANLGNMKLVDELDRTERVQKLIGEEQARAFGMRKILLADNFSFGEMLRRAVAAKGGKELTPDEKIKLEKLSKELRDLQRAIDKASKEMEIEPAKDAVDTLKGMLDEFKKNKRYSGSGDEKQADVEIKKQGWFERAINFLTGKERSLAESIGERMRKMDILQQRMESLKAAQKAKDIKPSLKEVGDEYGKGMTLEQLEAEFNKEHEALKGELEELHGIKKSTGPKKPKTPVEDFTKADLTKAVEREKLRKSMDEAKHAEHPADSTKFDDIRKVLKEHAKKPMTEADFQKELAKHGVTGDTAKKMYEHSLPTNQKVPHKVLERMLRRFIDLGDTDVHSLAGKISDWLKERGVNWSPEDVMRGISKYGQTTKPTSDFVKKTAREKRAEMLVLSQIETIQNELKSPKLTGYRRDKATQELRDLVKQRNQLMRKYKIESKSAESQFAGARDRAMTALENRLRDVLAEISGINSSMPKRPKVDLGERGEKMRKEVQELEAYLRDLKGRPNETPEQWNKRMERATENVIDNLNEAIRKQKFVADKKPTPEQSEKLKALIETKDSLAKKFRELRDASPEFKAKRQQGQERAAEKKLQEAIDALHGILPEPKRTQVEKTERTEKLQQRAKEIREYLAELKGKKDLTADVWNKRMEEGAQRSIDQMNEDIRKSSFVPEEKRTFEQSEKLKALLQAKAKLKESYDEMRDADPKYKLREDQLADRSLTRALERSVDYWQDRIDNKKFQIEKPEARERTAAQNDLQRRIDMKKVEFAKMKKNWELGQRTALERAQDWAVKLKRMFVLSSPVSVGKLTAAALSRVGNMSVEDLMGNPLSRILPEIANKGVLEGRSSFETISKAIADAISMSGKDIRDIWQTGHSELDAKFSKKGAHEDDWTGFFGKIHQILKQPVKRMAFQLAMAKQIRAGEAIGDSVTDPAVLARYGARAYQWANRQIFMQDNAITKGWNAMLGTLERNDMKGMATLGRILLPIVKVPTNIVGEAFTYVGGVPMAMANIAKAYKAGLENLTPEQAETILRQIKKGSIGTGLLALGFFNPQIAGGYYQPGQKKREDEAEFGHFKIGDFQVPSWMTHTPFFEAIQFGSTLRRVSDAQLTKNGDPQGLMAGATAAALGLLEEVPFVNEMMHVASLREKGGAAKFMNELVKSSVVPSLLDFAARQTDPNNPDGISPSEHPIDYLNLPAKKRETPDLTSTIKSGIPIARQTLPEKITDAFAPNSTIPDKIKDYAKTGAPMPSAPHKGALETKNGKIAPDVWERYVEIRGKAIQDEMLKSMWELKRADEEEQHKIIGRISSRATQTAKERLRLK